MLTVMRITSLAALLRFGPQKIRQIFYHLPKFLKLFWRLLMDSRVSLWPKLLLIFVIAYVFTPLDLLPDFIAGLGQLDDLIVIFLGLRGFVRLCPREVVREHVQAIAAGQ